MHHSLRWALGLATLVAAACGGKDESSPRAASEDCLDAGVSHAEGSTWDCAAGTCRCDAGVITTSAGAGGIGAGEGGDGGRGDSVNAGGGAEPERGGEGGQRGGATADGGAGEIAGSAGQEVSRGGAEDAGGAADGGATAGDGGLGGAAPVGSDPTAGDGGATAGDGGATLGVAGARADGGEAGAAATCAPTDPADEICDGLDNDCNGDTDEAFPEAGTPCDTGLPGVCAEGSTVCTEGTLDCIAQTLGDDETCNGLDDNCDGELDESFPEAGAPCDTGLPGVCAEGSTVCQDGGLGCAPVTPASAEACNGLDDDCNGFTDADAAGIDGEADADQDGHLSCDDCDDGDPRNWSACATCVDADEDGWDAVCDEYPADRGPDCDDDDADNWTSCDTCVDGDGDGVFVGCDAYEVRPGPDCDDDDPSVHRPCVRNTLLMVGDGMGVEQVRAAGMYAYGAAGTLHMETLPVQGRVTTASLSAEPTDSAAAASAMATGRKYVNGVISFANGLPVPTVMELQQAAGKSAGLVTTHTPFVDATPAAFGAHEASRNSQAAIAVDLSTGSRPNLLMGAADNDVTEAAFTSAGYSWVTTLAELNAVAPTATHIAGVFADDSPTLAERAMFAVTRLDQDPEGFFLLVEHEGTDEAGHANDLPGVIASALEFDDAVEAVMGWAAGRTDTIVIVLADHETGGLSVTETAPAVGKVPAHSFSSASHTAADVPIFVSGTELPAATIDNTEVFTLLGG